MTYSVSYRNRWWNRRRYACGYVQFREAYRTWLMLTRRGFGRVRLEQDSFQDRSPDA